jgi:hypothetical protein
MTADPAALRAEVQRSWATKGRTVRSARWDVRVRGRALEITTEPLRRGERLTTGLWAMPGIATSPTGKASRSRCTVSASGRACALTTRVRRPGRVRFSLGLEPERQSRRRGLAPPVA